MRRDAIAPRPDWRQRLAGLGLDGMDEDAVTYWNEEAAYVFSHAEIEILHDAVAELERLMRRAVAHVVDNNMFAELGIDPPLAALATASWRANEPSLYGRYDLQFDGTAPPKLLEYNADTPTALYEAAVIQWHWLEECYPKSDQFNSIHEGLLQTFAAMKPRLKTPLMHFTCVFDDDDDLRTTTYLSQLAQQSGIEAHLLEIHDIGWDGQNFRDVRDRPITALFKLYPWEWLAHDPFFGHLADRRVTMIEPAWRIIAASKGILAVLWRMFPGHPNLLPAAFDPASINGPHILKPLFGREGANIKTVGLDAGTGITGGPYSDMECVAQALAPLPCFDGRYPVIGAWVAGGEPHGLGIREDLSPITGRTAHFIPHRME
jgi:glutathionylspermidine synthase